MGLNVVRNVTAEILVAATLQLVFVSATRDGLELVVKMVSLWCQIGCWTFVRYMSPQSYSVLDEQEVVYFIEYSRCNLA